MARARRKQLDSKLAQVEQEVRAAGIQRTYTEVAAPFAGVILTRTIEPGVLAVPGAPLFTMEQEGAGALRFEANVEESRFGSIRLGQVVAVSAGGVLDKVNLRVAEIVPVVDPVSRTGIVKIDLPARAGLRSGMFGRAEFASGGSREALTIPATAVIERGQLQSVFAIDGQVARLRLVTLGDAGKQRVEVLSGLQAGERVVSPVPGGLTDGARVEVSR
jgi:RND family efflux transporter MFP subunit